MSKTITLVIDETITKTSIYNSITNFSNIRIIYLGFHSN